MSQLYTEALTKSCSDLQRALSEVSEDDPTGKHLKDAVQDSERVLKARLKDLQKAEREFEGADSFISEQAEHTERLVREQFEWLRRFLQEQEDSRIRAVRNEMHKKRSDLKEKTDAVSKEIDAVSEMLMKAEELQELPSEKPLDRLDVHRYMALISRTQRPLQEEQLCLGSGALLDQATHLGNLRFHVWSSLGSQIPHFPVILDPNTAHPRLSLSDDLSSVRRGGQNRPHTLDWDPSYVCVLGSQGFSSGAHTWDVCVPKMHWGLGVAAKGPEAKLPRMWRLWFYRGRFRWSPHPGSSFQIQTEVQPPEDQQPQDPFGAEFERVRVALDVDQGQLSFFYTDSQTLIYSVTDSFAGNTLFPLFYVHDTGTLSILPLDPPPPADTL